MPDAIGDKNAVRQGQSFGAHLLATITLGLPLVGAQLAQMAINTTDVVYLGRLGATDLAAGVLGTQTFFFFYIFGSGFTNAVMPMAAHAHGRGDETSLRRTVRMGIWIVVLYGTLTVIPMHFTTRILVAFGQKPEVAERAGDYIGIAQWAIFPALLIMALRAFFTAIGRAQIILWATLAGTLLNLLLGYAFIFGHFGAPALGIRGAAIGALGTNSLIFIVLAAVAARAAPFARYGLFVRLWRADGSALGDIVRLGLPVSMTIIAEVGLFMMSSLMMGWLGTIALAAHGIALQLASIAFMIPLGLSQVGTARVGQAHGRGDLAGLDRAAKAVIVVGLGVSLAGATLFWLIPGPLIGLFLDTSNPLSGAVVRFAAPLLAVAAAFQLADCLQVLGSGLLRGLRDTRVPMLLAVFSYWIVGLPAGYVLGFVAGLGGVGVWSGLASGLVCAAILANWRFQRREAFGLV